jgi:hypothetical protein
LLVPEDMVSVNEDAQNEEVEGDVPGLWVFFLEFHSGSQSQLQEIKNQSSHRGVNAITISTMASDTGA